MSVAPAPAPGTADRVGPVAPLPGADPVPGSIPLTLVTVPLVLVLGLLLLQPVAATGEVREDDDPAAVETLRRALRAAVSVAYSSEQVLRTWGPTGATTRVLTVHQDGEGRRRLQEGGAGTGTGRAALLEPGAAPTAQVDVLALVTGAYALRLEPGAAVLGRPASVVVAGDGGRVAARLWVDEATGVLLRQEAYDVDGRTVHEVVLTRFLLGPAGSSPGLRGVTAPAAGPRSAARGGRTGPLGLALLGRQDPGTADAGTVPAAAGRPLAPEELEQLRRDGCTCPAELPSGYRLVDARAGQLSVTGGADGDPTARVTHLTYADGLFSISVFVQRGRLAGPPPGREDRWGSTPVHLVDGWPLRVVWQGGESVLTAVSDAPLEDVRAVVSAIPQGPSEDDVLSRVGRGLRRVLEAAPG